ncbi:hypothetical protein [Pantoea pleuroti]|uniref:hypothetical protein n=1 Tax=Pantoea pleuroti TaxID=1592631 RepID=UPI0015FB59BE|nr:hypothetical protein [Pantoea pleuroti]MBB1228828.1 hypothetical protein [Pantoea pleuroti]
MNIELKITLWALACAYAILNSFIYSWSFWSAFDISILQFASFSDIFPSILYTITIPCIVAIIGLASAEFWDRIQRKTYSILGREILVFGKHYNYMQTIMNMLSGITFTACSLILIVLIYIYYKKPVSVQEFVSSEFGQFTIPILISFIAIFIILYKTNFLKELNLKRQLCIIIICFIPSVCFIWGHVNSSNIKNGIDTFLIESDGKCKSPSDVKYRYISSISDKVFAMSLSDRSVCIFKYDSLKLTPENGIAHMKVLPINSI